MKDSNPNKTDPCKRLLQIVKKIRMVDPETSILRTWITVFDLPESSSLFEVFPRIQALNDLIIECKKMVEIYADNDNKKRYLHSLNVLSNVLQKSNFGGNLRSISNSINELLVRDLEYCSVELKHYTDEIVIPREDIEGLLNEVLELKKSLLNQNLDSLLKKHCIALLQAIEEAIIDYQIKGVESLQEVYMTQFVRMEYIKSRIDPKQKSKFEKLFDDVFRYVRVASDTHSAFMLAITAISEVKKMLS